MAVPLREVRLAVDTRQEARAELAQVPYHEERDIGECVFGLPVVARKHGQAIFAAASVQGRGRAVQLVQALRSLKYGSRSTVLES